MYVQYAISEKYMVSDAKAGVKGEYDEAEIIHINNYTEDGKMSISTLDLIFIILYETLCKIPFLSKCFSFKSIFLSKYDRLLHFKQYMFRI